MRRFATVLLLVLPTLTLCTRALAWDSPGHQQIADIAWSQLTPNAKKQVAAILAAGDAQFKPSGPSDAAVRSAFRRAATFPDFIKTHRDTSYEQEVQTLNDKFHATTDPLVSGNEKQFCKSWHYYDKPIRFSGAEPPVAQSNALAALTLARGELARLQQMPNPDRRMQAWWLAWIEHVTGDLHQPLHCTSSFASGQSDNGGNGFKLGIPDPAHPSGKMALHMYWDAGIDHVKKTEQMQGQEIRVDRVTTRWNAAGLVMSGSAEATNLDVMSWITDGAKAADDKVYKGITEGGTPDGTYNQTQEALCKRQALLAGYRLANVLNSTLGN